jgi:cell division protein FtsI/penicillin-binding protein 2
MEGREYRRAVVPGDAVNMGIGQGFVTATPLQIANAYSAISSSGVLRKPLLVRKISEWRCTQPGLHGRAGQSTTGIAGDA